jgi:hypothetical protein
MTMQVAQRQLVGFPSSFTVADGDAAYNTSAEVAALVEANTASGIFALIWQKTVPAQQILRWGSGNANQQRNQGFLYGFFLDATTGFEDGILRLQVANATETRVTTVAEFNTAILHTTTVTSAITATPSDISNMRPLPEAVNFPAAGEDSFLQLMFKTQTPTTTVDVAGFSIPVTIYQ